VIDQRFPCSLAAVHLPAWFAVGFAGVIIFAMAWYWPRLGRPEIPPERRRVRRLSLLFGLVGLCAATIGFGIVDPDARPVPYAMTWFAASVALLIVVLLAVLDAILSMRLHRRAISAMRNERERSLGRAIADARRKQAERTDGESES
jgi:hypothetical protein